MLRDNIAAVWVAAEADFSLAFCVSALRVSSSLTTRDTIHERCIGGRIRKVIVRLQLYNQFTEPNDGMFQVLARFF